MRNENTLIRFDWAAKRILRDKANFGVLEGFVSVLTGQTIRIQEILESESNQDSADAKYNRVDIMARNSKDELIIIEIQLTRQVHYLERILFGVGKALSDRISKGDSYGNVKKVYSISILYFDIGKGDDYAYYGQTKFHGLHSGKEFELSERDRVGLGMKSPADIFPEYYLICVNQFDDVAKTPLDEWMDYLKNDRVKDGTTTPGLREAADKLRYLKMSPKEKSVYDHYVDSLIYEQDCLETAKTEGRAEEKMDVARNILSMNLDMDIISKATGLPEDIIRELKSGTDRTRKP